MNGLKNQIYCGFLTEYHGSLNSPLQANCDIHEQIFAQGCNNSGETRGSRQNKTVLGLRALFGLESSDLRRLEQIGLQCLAFV